MTGDSGHEMVRYIMAIYDCAVPEYDICHRMTDESAQGLWIRGIQRLRKKRSV